MGSEKFPSLPPFGSMPRTGDRVTFDGNLWTVWAVGPGPGPRNVGLEREGVLGRERTITTWRRVR